MEVENPKNEGISVISVISEHGTIAVTEVQSIHDHNIHNQAIIIDDQEKQEGCLNLCNNYGICWSWSCLASSAGISIA